MLCRQCLRWRQHEGMLSAAGKGTAQRGRTDLARHCHALQASVSFLETQLYMLRLPAWRQVLKKITGTAVTVNGPAPRCACSQCRAVGVALTGEGEGSAVAAVKEEAARKLL